MMLSRPFFFDNRRVEPSCDYTYDAAYKLIEASGREHLGQLGQPNSPGPFYKFRSQSPRDGNAMGAYVESYGYDAVGNILTVQHRGSSPVNPGWTRRCSYNEPSQLETGKVSNRLSATSIGSTSEPYSYEGSAGLHGNMTSMPHLSLMQWNCLDQLSATSKQVFTNGGTPEITWYIYDLKGMRLLKVTGRQAATGETPTRMKERIHMGGFEVYRQYDQDGEIVNLERETFHVMGGDKRVALVETRTKGSDPAPSRLIRYQYTNYLGSAVLELDDQARIISYEEYTPYGNSSYQAVRSDTETPKRYRYTGKERDEENGFYYYGARYYACWLGRWVNCDPTGSKDGPVLYQYGRDNPLMFDDPTGTQSEPRQLWLAGSPAFEIDTVATRSGRGITELQREALKGVDKAFGPGTGLDWGHSAHGITPAGTTITLRPQLCAENRASVADKLRKQAEKAAGRFTRDSRGRDLSVKPGTTYQQPAPKGWEREFADYGKGRPTTPTTSSSSAPATSTAESGVAEATGASAEATAAPSEAAAVSSEATAAPPAAEVESAAASSGTKAETVAVETAEVSAKAEKLAAGSAEIASTGKSLLGTVASKAGAVSKVLGTVGGGIALGVDLAKVATAKTADERVDAGIAATGDALMMSKNPVAMAAGGGVLAGQALEHSLHVSDASADVRVGVYTSLKKAGLNDTASLVLGGAATVATTPFALVGKIGGKIISWL